MSKILNLLCIDCGLKFERLGRRPNKSTKIRCSLCLKFWKKHKVLERALQKGTKLCNRSGCSSMKQIPLTQKFCSKSCSSYSSRWNVEPMKYATCNVCGIIYGKIRPASRKKVTCGSQECLLKRKSEANKGKIVSIETRQKLSQVNKGKRLSFEHRRNIGRGVAGSRNGLYIDGRSMVPDYEAYEDFGRALKRDIKERDGYKCKVCGSHQQLVIHHIDNNKKNSNIDNLITLCNSCHSLVHGVNEPRKGDIHLFRQLKEKLKCDDHDRKNDR